MLFRCTFSASSFMRTSTEHDNRHITRIIAHCWNALPERQKAYWYRRALEEKQHHAELFPGYRFTPTSRANRQKRNVKRNSDADKERSRRIAELLLAGKHGDELDVAVKQDDAVHSDSDGSYRSESPETRPAKAHKKSLTSKARKPPRSRTAAISAAAPESLSVPTVNFETVTANPWDYYSTEPSSIYAPQASYPPMLPHAQLYQSHSPALSSGSAHSYGSSSSPSHQVAQMTEQFAYTSVTTPPQPRATDYYSAGSYDTQERHPSPDDTYSLAYPLSQDYLNVQDTYTRGLNFEYPMPSGYATSYSAGYQPSFMNTVHQSQPSGEYYPEYSNY
ncbi:hypothetical protein CONPUDRAFT_94716 [Coniophora puteana RWD-64-598 SS2]|uniref:HMG box domain-containing protein n=1 Tax=Coniophora puteana (strain RWD-64-598) TaxID=741705 RepID=A0A5M3N664_CONPW|nr:uncharacterized protein CONPUDRAFT_94716 [Coniophora puteana RWD-64-598 SS2]EIW86355.1 hypothetical protein CONPUDRAFT_94716 [Coniophora puteana RWD-64-598 SS2]